MKFIIFLICVPFVYSELHRFMTTYTGINGTTMAGIPEFSAVTTLDDQQIDYYDSNIMELIPRKNWIKDFASTHMWKKDTKIRKHVQQIYKNNIHVVMQRFNQSHGVHTYQRMYGCEWDDETGDSQGFDQYAYDGEDFISLDLKELRYITSVPQAELTVMKWNNDRTQLELLKQYYEDECVYWLKKFLKLSKATLEKAEPPKVFLLQKNPGNFMCHVTGFLFRNTTISWRTNGRDVNNSCKLETGDTLPNEDGTFQRNLTLYVLSDKCKENQYTCVVEHKAEKTEKILTVNMTQRSKPGLDALYILIIIIPAFVALIALYVHKNCRKEIKARKY
ncbi:hypothetical protein ABG768_001549 [Culter alburnus]|uniref:Ig-like domain-containing protein n=1 Tax=Culter alburnus TaxID=194366 RepID=A0AAW2A1E0_CULAL